MESELNIQASETMERRVGMKDKQMKWDNRPREVPQKKRAAAEELERAEDWEELSGAIQRKAVRLGGVRTSNVRILAMDGTVVRLAKRMGIKVSEAVWHWIDVQQREGCTIVQEGMERKARGPESRQIPGWREDVRLRIGWKRNVAAEEQGKEIDGLLKVLQTLWMKEWDIEQEQAMAHMVWECLIMSKGTLRDGWRTQTRRFKGRGGYGKYLMTVGTLMQLGAVAGVIEEEWQGRSWWEQSGQSAKECRKEWEDRLERMREVHCLQEEEAEQEEPREAAIREGKAGRTSSRRQGKYMEGGGGKAMMQVSVPRKKVMTETVWVVIDWMSGSQSLRQAVKKVAPWAVYVPLDIQSTVFSVAEGMGWVTNVEIDLVKTKEEEVWRVVTDYVQKQKGKAVTIRTLLLAMSPCCKTFSKANNANIRKDNHYRDCKHKDRPPKDRHSDKGKLAMRADAMVRQGIKLSKWLEEEQGAAYYMENPVGDLHRRPYMRCWEKEGSRREVVHYCAYGHWIMKPTHIWTNMQWKPVGLTGDGRCKAGVCKAGKQNAMTGRWVHKVTLAGVEQKAVKGKGRKAKSMMMPRMLHEEMLHTAKARWQL